MKLFAIFVASWTLVSNAAGTPVRNLEASVENVAGATRDFLRLIDGPTRQIEPHSEPDSRGAQHIAPLGFASGSRQYGEQGHSVAPFGPLLHLQQPGLRFEGDALGISLRQPSEPSFSARPFQDIFFYPSSQRQAETFAGPSQTAGSRSRASVLTAEIGVPPGADVYRWMLSNEGDQALKARGEPRNIDSKFFDLLHRGNGEIAYPTRYAYEPSFETALHFAEWKFGLLNVQFRTGDRKWYPLKEDVARNFQSHAQKFFNKYRKDMFGVVYRGREYIVIRQNSIEWLQSDTPREKVSIWATRNVANHANINGDSQLVLLGVFQLSDPKWVALEKLMQPYRNAPGKGYMKPREVHSV